MFICKICPSFFYAIGYIFFHLQNMYFFFHAIGYIFYSNATCVFLFPCSPNFFLFFSNAKYVFLFLCNRIYLFFFQMKLDHKHYISLVRCVYIYIIYVHCASSSRLSHFLRYIHT